MKLAKTDSKGTEHRWRDWPGVGERPFILAGWREGTRRGQRLPDGVGRGRKVNVVLILWVHFFHKNGK